MERHSRPHWYLEEDCLESLEAPCFLSASKSVTVSGNGYARVHRCSISALMRECAQNMEFTLTCGLSHHYQLKMSEWLANELRIQRSEDVLTDPER